MKIILLSFLQSLLALLIFALFLTFSDFTGGSIGMAPLLYGVIISIALILDILLYVILNRFLKRRIVFFYINFIVFVIMEIVIDFDSVKFVLEYELSSFLVRSVIFSFALATIIILFLADKLKLNSSLSKQ